MPYNKYHNRKSRLAGMEFDSKLEMDRYIFLREAQRGGLIRDLRRQVAFQLLPQWRRAGRVYRRATTYIADFTYTKDGILVIEDAKGYETPVFRLKETMLHFILGKDVRKVKHPAESV